MPRSSRRGRALRLSLLALCTLFIPFHFTYANEPLSNPLIGEIQWSGSSLSTADEWIELWNPGTEPLSLEGWSLTGASTNPIFFTSADTIPPQGVFLVANYPATSDKTLLTNVTINVATTTLSLANDKILITLQDPGGTVQDTVETGSKPPAGSSTPLNTSMIRVHQASGWTWESATQPFHPNAPDLGTPGICDGCLAPSEIVTASPTATEITVPTTTTEIIATTTTEALPPPSVEDPEPEEVSTLLPVATTSTEPFLETVHALVDEETSTTTEGVLQETPTPTSTAVTAPPAEEATSTPPIPVISPATPTPTSFANDVAQSPTPTPTPTPPPASPVSTPVPVSVPTPPLLDPVMTEIMAAPLTNEEEWIELTLPANTSAFRYVGWRLVSDEKTVFSFTTSSIQALNPQGAYLLPAWTSAKLKNAGATVRLQRADGTTAQEMRYGESVKGTSWIRDAASATWKLTYRPTKGSANILQEAPASVPTPAPAAVSTPVVLTTSVAPPTTTTTTNIPPAVPVEDPKPIVQTPAPQESFIPPPAPEKKVAAAKTTAPKATASTKKSLVLPTSVTRFEHIPPEQLTPRVRVRLQGLVGSTVGVFGKHLFVLLAPDGRGLLVRSTTAQPSPALGETVEVTGLLFANDDGVQLQMETGDTWQAIPQKTGALPRVVDWNAPGLEDQWSFTKLEGLVTDSKATSITLESHVGEITIPIKAILGYRAQRVKKGDTIEVQGIFDGRAGVWKIQPSKDSDIVILRAAETAVKAAGTSPSNTKLPWNAIGIALGSVGAIEGIRRWLEKRKTASILPKRPLSATT